jgi:PPOX class probable F420-dependent enzyme
MTAATRIPAGHGQEDDDKEEAMAEPMSPQRRQEFLAEGTRTAILATTRQDGRPHAVPVCFVLDGDDILFLTNADSVKGAGMRRDPRVTLVVDDQTPPFAFAMIEGTAEMSQDPDQLRHAAVEISRRYDGGHNTEQFIHFATTALGSLVRIRPTRTLALDRVGEH